MTQRWPFPARGSAVEDVMRLHAAHIDKDSPLGQKLAAGASSRDGDERTLREIRNYIAAADLGGIKAEWLAVLDRIAGVPA